MLRNKRYNYACQEVFDCEQKNKKLKKEIKMLKEDLIHLKNNLLVQEKDKTGREIDVELSTNPEEEMEIIEKEKEKNRNLLELGKKYNDVEKAYQLVLQNLNSMIENEKQNPINVTIDESPNEIEQLELTNDELKKVDEVEFCRKERDDLNNYTLTPEEEEMAKNAELNDKDLEEIKRTELVQLDKIIKKDEEEIELSDEEREIIDEIIAIELSSDEKKNAKDIKLTDDEEKCALQKLKSDASDLSSEDKKRKIENFKELKVKFKKYKIQEKKDNTGYKIKKMKKNKVDMIKNYEILLKKVATSFDQLYLMHNKQEFLNLMKSKGIEANYEPPRANLRKSTKKGTRKGTKRLPTNKRYLKTDKYIITEDKDEEDDKSNYDPDVKILNKFLKEQKKEKENFISGKIKITTDEKK
jgi:hypothetical protein